MKTFCSTHSLLNNLKSELGGAAADADCAEDATRRTLDQYSTGLIMTFRNFVCGQSFQGSQRGSVGRLFGQFSVRVQPDSISVEHNDSEVLKASACLRFTVKSPEANVIGSRSGELYLSLSQFLKFIFIEVQFLFFVKQLFPSILVEIDDLELLVVCIRLANEDVRHLQLGPLSSKYVHNLIKAEVFATLNWSLPFLFWHHQYLTILNTSWQLETHFECG